MTDLDTYQSPTVLLTAVSAVAEDMMTVLVAMGPKSRKSYSQTPSTLHT